MGSSGLLQRLREWLGDLGLRLYLWAYYEGDVQRFRNEIAEDVGRQEASDRRNAWLSA